MSVRSSYPENGAIHILHGRQYYQPLVDARTVGLYYLHVFKTLYPNSRNQTTFSKKVLMTTFYEKMKLFGTPHFTNVYNKLVRNN